VIEPNWPAYKEALQYIGARAISVHTTSKSVEPSVERVKSDKAEHEGHTAQLTSNPTGKIIAAGKSSERSSGGERPQADRDK